jgi:hypothetical protein
MRLPWIIASVLLILLVAAALLDALSGHGSGTAIVVAWCLVTLVPIAFGLLVATRRQGHPIGWLLLANGAVLVLVGFADAYARYSVLGHPGALPGGDWAVVVSDRAWPLFFVGVTAIGWVFPDGRLPSPRWRPWALAAALSFAGLIVCTVLEAVPFGGPFADVPRPFRGVSGAVIGVPLSLCALGSVGALVGAALAVRSRLHRASGIERQQLRWLAYAAALVPVAVAICLVEVAVTGEDGPVALAGGMVALTAVPTAVGVAILRYRLYEIDRLINRTLVYSLLTATLAAVFAGISLGIGVAVGSGSTLATAAATLAVALLFGPLRGRVQLLVDRRFDRARYAGLRTVQQFLEDLRAGRAAPEATGAMLAEALGDPELELRFRLDGDIEVDAAGRVVEGPDPPGRVRTPVRRGGLALATVVHPRSPSGPICWTAPSARRGWRSRSRACASRCAASSPRSRRRAPASLPPATRSDAGSSATSTTARSSGWSRSASPCATCSTVCPTRPRSMPWWSRSRARLRSCASSRAACARPASTTGSATPCASWRRARS